MVGTLPWRVGRSIGRTLYDADDEFVGLLDTRELATRVVAAVNRFGVTTSPGAVPALPADYCWHCGDGIEPEPAPHCEACPPFGDCDDEGCLEPGCVGELGVVLARDGDRDRQNALAACQRALDGHPGAAPTPDDDDEPGRLDTAIRLLRRVLYEPNTSPRNRELISDIRGFVEGN
jgi:hypothetical protein